MLEGLVSGVRGFASTEETGVRGFASTEGVRGLDAGEGTGALGTEKDFVLGVEAFASGDLR